MFFGKGLKITLLAGKKRALKTKSHFPLSISTTDKYRRGHRTAREELD